MENLQRVLNELHSSQQERGYAGRILNAVYNLFDSDKNDLVDRSILENAFSVLLAEVGPSDVGLRDIVLKCLSQSIKLTSSSWNAPREVLLNMVSICFHQVDRTIQDESNVTKSLLDILTQMVQSDPHSTILPVLKTLSNIPHLWRESWNLALDTFKIMAGRNSSDSSQKDLLRTLFQLLLDNARTGEEIQEVIHCVRGLDAVHFFFTFSFGEALWDILQENNPNSNRYLEECMKSAVGMLVETSVADLERLSPKSIDWVVLLALIGHSQHSTELKSILVSEKEYIHHAFPWDDLCQFASKVGQNETLREKLAPAFLSLGFSLLLAPMQRDEDASSCENTLLRKASDFLFHLHRNVLNESLQSEFVLSLLTLTDDHKMSESANKTAWMATAHAAYDILDRLFQHTPQSLYKFTNDIRNRLLVNDGDSNSSLILRDCGIIASSLHDCSSTSTDEKEILIFVQNLLFRRQSHYVSRGMMLSWKIMEIKTLSHDDREFLRQWISRILLPHNRRTVAPQVGYWGLHCLAASQSLHEFFPQLKVMMANTGLVQILKHVSNQQMTLAYTKIPLSYSRGRKNRQMVFCLHSFLKRLAPFRENLQETLVWVYNLVSNYLKMGRSSKWVPDGWLLASVELPPVENSTLLSSLVDNMHVTHDEEQEDETTPEFTTTTPSQVKTLVQFAHIMVLSIGMNMAVLENSFEHFQQNVPKSLAQLLRYQIMKLSNMRSQCHTCVAMLRYFKRLITRKSKQRQTKKRATLRAEGETVELDKETGEIARTIDETIQQVRMSLHLLFRTEAFLDSDILWNLVLPNTNTDMGDDNVLKTFVLLESSEEATENYDSDKQENIIRLIDLRTHVLLTLTRRHQTMIATSYSFLNVSKSSFILNCGLDPKLGLPSSLEIENSTGKQAYILNTLFQTSILLLPWLRKLRTFHAKTRRTIWVQRRRCQHPWEYVSLARGRELTAAYLIATSYAILFIEREGIYKRVTFSGNSVANDSLSKNSKSIAGRKSDPLSAKDNEFSKETLSKYYETVSEKLISCDDASIACQLLDILCLLANATGDGQYFLQSLEMGQKMLHTIFATGTGVMDGMTHDDGVTLLGTSSGIPLSFLTAMEDLLERKRKISGTVCDSITRLMKYVSTNTSIHEDHTLLKNILLSSCGMMVASQAVNFMDLRTSVLTLHEFMVQIDEGGQETQEKNGMSSLNQHVLSTRKSAALSPIPGLHERTFVTFHELLCELVLVIFALSTPMSSYQRVTRPNPDEQDSEEVFTPFYVIEEGMRVFNDLLYVFISKNHLFPRKSTSTLLGACPTMFRLVEHQLSSCVEWRASQPLLSAKERRAGYRDVGAIRYLQELLQRMVESVEGILSFCKFATKTRTLSPLRADEDGDDTASEENDPKKQKKASPLFLQGEKVVNKLKDVASTHNLELPHTRPRPTRQDRRMGALGRNSFLKKRTTLGFHKDDAPNISENDSETRDQIGDSRKKQKRSKYPKGKASKQGVTSEGFAVRQPGTSDHSISTSEKSEESLTSTKEIEWNGDLEERDKTKSIASGSSLEFGAVGVWGSNEAESEEDDNVITLELEE